MSKAASQTPSLTPKEQKVFHFIKAYAEKHGYAPTYAEIQEKFHYKAIASVQQFVSQLTEKGYLKAPLGESKKRALEVCDQDRNARDSSELVSLPLEGLVAAGKFTEAVQNREYIDIPRSLLKNPDDYFALKVKGDSMIDECIMDGDYVVIRRQHHASNGQTVVALFENDATIKKYYRKNERIELHPANPRYEIIKVKQSSEFKILGVLASVIRRLE